MVQFMPVSSLQRVAILLEGRVEYERNVLQGIRDFAAGEVDWLIRLELPGGHTLGFLDEWQPDGVLFQAAGLPEKVLRFLERFPKPCLHVSDSLHSLSVDCVGLDNEAIGREAAAYFLDRRLESLAFVGVAGVKFSQTRGDAFCRIGPSSRGRDGPEGAWLLATGLERGRTAGSVAGSAPQTMWAIHHA